MKIQCVCGTKYSFDVTPEMVRNPIRFVCQSCGQDSSEAVNQAIRQQFAPEVPSGAPASIPIVLPPAAPVPTVSPGIRLRDHAGSSTSATSPAAPVPPAGSSGLRVALATSTPAREEAA